MKFVIHSKATPKCSFEIKAKGVIFCFTLILASLVQGQTQSTVSKSAISAASANENPPPNSQPKPKKVN